jgi:hypothetical protein
MQFVMEMDLENLGTNLGPAMARRRKCGRVIPLYFERRGAAMSLSRRRAAAERTLSAETKPLGMTSKIKCLTRDSSGQRT